MWNRSGDPAKHELRSILAAWGAVALLALSAGMAGAVSPQEWSISDVRDVSKGDTENLSVGDDGALSLAPELELVGETGEPLIWDMIEDARGTVYVATGNDGRVYSITGSEAPVLLFDSPQSQIQSLALDEQGNLYAGSAPDGIIYKIPPGGQGTVFCRTTETYVWDMEFRDGVLHAATGNSGRVLAIGPDGQVTAVVLDSPDPHIVSLIPDGAGGFYAGTEGTGLVYHIDVRNGTRLLYQAPESEIHRMVVGGDGRLYVAAVPGRQRAPQQGPEANEAGGSIYRLEPSGAVTKLWTAPYPLILAMEVYDSSHILVGVGPRGVLYLLSNDGRVDRIADTGESQPAVIRKRRNGEILLGMGNSGRVKRLTTSRSLIGHFTTEVHDAEAISEWGRVEVIGRTPAGSAIRVDSRSGNREVPGREWSDWVALAGPNNDRIASPPGQFLQLRATLTRSPIGESPVLSAMTVVGQQVNLRPLVGPVLVAPYSTQQRSSSSNNSDSDSNGDSESRTSRVSRTSRSSQLLRRTLLAVRWGASDPNNDKMSFDLYYRRVGAEDWLLLDQIDDKRSYVWDVEGTPEGLSELKIVASDRPDNPWETALTAEYVSNPFHIDYSSPSVTLQATNVRPDGAVDVRGLAVDVSGTLRKGEYSIDSEDWLVFFPQDNIFDSTEETISFATEVLEPGRHTIVVKVTDAAGNVGSASAVVVIPER